MRNLINKLDEGFFGKNAGIKPEIASFLKNVKAEISFVGQGGSHVGVAWTINGKEKYEEMLLEEFSWDNLVTFIKHESSGPY